MHNQWGRLFRTALLTICFSATVATATVTQVDGVIVPASNAMQAALDSQGESINAIVDAAEVPEVFTPRLSSPVVFLDIAEGAGFENSFGWYNVGDDVSTASGRAQNLHPILGCGIPMVNAPNNPLDLLNHYGNPAHYRQTTEPGQSASVDFAVELASGRYKGGFIAFYLITPEANPSGNNCGDFKNGSDGQSLFGYIYFTQKDLSNDGDFVHHLVYASPSDSQRFYFGFEDLFRGGDNDYEDMAVRIDGLVPPCIPQPETCDGRDNDCDGLVDNADPGLTGLGNACSCDGSLMSCEGGIRFGECRTGVTICTSGAIICQSTVGPVAETCNGLDDNCNNTVDDNPSDDGGTCDGPDGDLCPEGTVICTAGGLVCNDATTTNSEVCNGLDDDCNGIIDDAPIDAGAACGSSVGQCDVGSVACVAGSLVCQGGTGPSPELCNGLDDDCDGVADETPVDVGVACGQSDIGACALGQTICVSGSLACAGELGPGIELCNGIDDDCDGTIDDGPVDTGQPCGESAGLCEPGIVACVGGALQCQGGAGPMSETCNGFDDDCNGVADDDVPGEGVPCQVGDCGSGLTECIAGGMTCVGGAALGTEICNGLDDDCDGLIDEGELCEGGQCNDGTCAVPCLGGEFPCPPGQLCNEQNLCIADPCFGITCPDDPNGGAQVCQAGTCRSICDGRTCPGALVCRPSDGACVPNNCDFLDNCSVNEVCIASTCLVDPCADVTCPASEFCRAGSCIKSCEGVVCSQGQTCEDGVCVQTGCAATCAEGLVCSPDSGACVPSMCRAITCPPNQDCEPLTGACAPSLCIGVQCPDGQTCKRGQCGTPATDEEHVTTGGAGCHSSHGLGWLALVLTLMLQGRGRRRHTARALSVMMVALGLGACNPSDYCLNCEKTVFDAAPSLPDAPSGGCDIGVIQDETCNGLDDDCDGFIDDGFDLQTDEANCGTCGVPCSIAGAQSQCVSGACAFVACYPGYADVNNDATDGCEYACFVSNAGVEACDGLDNDCDGLIDEETQLDVDPLNCGQCGRACEFLGVANATCEAGVCGFLPGACAPSYYDSNGQQADGCEYQCVMTNGGIEACDAIDNDCDGQIDESFDLVTDPLNCGVCGRVCAVPGATASCALGTCTFDATTDCLAGFVDVNGLSIDGCEYACTASGPEICDGIDNDCDAFVDNDVAMAGAPCSVLPTPAGECAADGQLACSQGAFICVGATLPSPELCDGLDNDCDLATDELLSVACYTGPPATLGIGECSGGAQACMGGSFGGTCVGEVLPTTETCNNRDDDCNGDIDDAGGMAIVEACYGGAVGTEGIGACRAGVRTCTFGTFGTCAGEVQNAPERCGDGIDSDCDNIADAQEGCLAAAAELRIDAPGGALGTTEGAVHSFDATIAAGGVPLGTRLYAVWTESNGGTTDILFRRSNDSGATWDDIINLTSGVGARAVKPVIAVAAGTTDKVVVAFQSATSGVRDVHAILSADSGATFGAATGALDASGDSFHHDVAIANDGASVVITWEQLNTSTLNRDIVSRRSSDGGVSYAAAVTVNAGSAGATTRFAGRPRVALLGAGDVVWVWREARGTQTRDIYAARATGAAAPTTDIRLDGDTNDTRDSDFPRIAAAGAQVYAVWQDISSASGGGSDAMFVRSTNGGTSWQAEHILDDPIAEVSPSLLPSIAIDARTSAPTDDVVAVAWEDRREGTQAFVNVSTNGGASFAGARRASHQDGEPVIGIIRDVEVTHAGNSRIGIAYLHQPAGQQPHLRAATSLDDGATWDYTHILLDGGTGPALGGRLAPIHVAPLHGFIAVWNDFRTAPSINGDPMVRRLSP